MKSLNQIVSEIFYDLIIFHLLEIEGQSENTTILHNNHCKIIIKINFGELYFHLIPSQSEIKIDPLLWGITIHNFDFQKIVPFDIHPEMSLIEGVIQRLTCQKVFINLFCNELLDGTKSEANIKFYKENKDEINLKLNTYFSSLSGKQ